MAISYICTDKLGNYGVFFWTDVFKRKGELSLEEEAYKCPKAVLNRLKRQERLSEVKDIAYRIVDRLMKQERWFEVEEIMDKYL